MTKSALDKALAADLYLIHKREPKPLGFEDATLFIALFDQWQINFKKHSGHYGSACNFWNTIVASGCHVRSKSSPHTTNIPCLQNVFKLSGISVSDFWLTSRIFTDCFRVDLLKRIYELLLIANFRDCDSMSNMEWVMKAIWKT